MPRTSQAARATARISSIDRLAPPPELSADEAVIFRQTVAAAPPDFFRAKDLVLLNAYCRAAALERRAAEQLAAAVAAGTASKPWLAIYTQVSRTLLNLTIRLRIGPRSRDNSRRRAGKPDSGALSYYEVMHEDIEEDRPRRSTARTANGQDAEP